MFDLYADTPCGKPRAHEVFERCLAGQEVHAQELEGRRSDGRHVWVSLSMKPIRDGQGHLQATRSTLADITDRKQAEAALRESEERWSRILASAMDAIVTVDEDGRVVLFNAAAEMMFRCAAAEAIGRPFGRFCSEPLWATLSRDIRAGVHGGSHPHHLWVPAGLTARRASGEEFPIEATISQVDAGGRHLSTVILRDMDDRKRAEAALHQLQLANEYLQEEIRTKVWYILTDVDDQEVATLLGLNFSAKLTFAANGARTANFDSQGRLIFDHGTVDFSPDRRVVPGPADAPFPPVEAQPGAVGSADYSPLVRVLNAGGVIYNAPIVAFGVEAADITFPNGGVDYRKVHDEVVAIDPSPGKQTVTLSLVNGFSFGRPLWYLSMDCSTPSCAAIEHNTFAPLLQQIVTGFDDSFPSPVERIFIATNRPSEGACGNPQRQGLFADLLDGHRPNNTFGGIPTIAPDYSPLWNAQLFEWTPDTVAKGFRGQLREEFQILTYVDDGLLTGPNGAPFGDSLFIINCPPVQRLD